MSLAKMNRFGRGSGRRPAQSRKANARKQEWVSTIQDLNVHKATPEELKRRHELHKSQNRLAAQWEMKERHLKPESKSARLDPAHLRIIREVFSDQNQLQDVLARCDGTLAVVKDLFGDAPHRQTGLPNVTVAPDSGPDADLPVQLRPDPPTPLSVLSQSVMDPRALNEIPDVRRRENDGEESDSASSGRLSSRADMSRFGRSPQEEIQGPGSQQEPPQSAHPGSPSYNSQLSARESRLSGRGQRRRGEHAVHGAPPENPSRLSVLQCMLGELEAELDSLEWEEPPGSAPTEHAPPGLTGFSVSLLRTVSRLARCLRQTRKELQREAQERKRLEEEVTEQRCLIDALTAETLALREGSAALQVEGRPGRPSQTLQASDEIQQESPAGGCRGDGVGDILKGQQRVWDAEQRRTARASADSTASYCVESEAGALYCERKDPERTAPAPAYRDHLPPPPSPDPAVLLSPPRQRNSQGGPHPHPTERITCPQREPVHRQEKRSGDPEQNRSSQAAVLQQITQLTLQNALIRAQLQQFCTEPAGPRGPGPQAAPHRAAPERAPPAGSSMEQRLLELNRQSAEAQSRLLELMEEQTQTSVSTGSPSVSPILPNRLAYLTDGERRTPDVSVPVPEQNLSPASSNCGRVSTSRSSVNVPTGGNQSTLTQSPVDRLKDEEWLALFTRML